MKKIKIMFMVFVLMFVACFTGIGMVNAAFAKSITVYKASKNHGVSYFEVKQSGYSHAFCMQNGIPGPNSSGYKMTLKKEITAGPRAYIANSGKDRYIKSKALWIYNHSVNSSYSKAWPSSGSDYKAAKSLADAAKKAGSSYSPVPAVKSITTPKMTKSGNYYTSQKIKVTLNHVSGNSYSVSFSGAPSGTKVINKSGLTFQVRVPVSSVTKTKTFTIKITGKKTSYYSAAWYVKSKRQDMLVTKSTSKSPTKTVKATVTFKKCHKIGDTYYGPNGTKVTLSQYVKSSCVKTCAKDSVTGKYIDKNKNAYDSEKAAYLKSCFPCQKHGSKYVDANGSTDGGIKGYAKTCAKPCATTKDKLGFFYDNDYNYYTKNTDPAFLKSCAYCDTYNGYYYGKNGNKLANKEAQNAECIGVCKYENGKYYGPNGKLLSNINEYVASSCVTPCKKDPVTGKYVDTDRKYYNSDTDPNYMKSCNPYCDYKDGQYYDKNNKPVQDQDYYNSCKPSCGIENGQYYDKNHRPVSYEEYLKSCVPEVPIPEPVKSVDTDLIRYEKDFHYTIKHEMPYRASSAHYKSYVFTDVLEEPLQIKSAANVKIMQLDTQTNKEEDWTSKFDIKIDGQKVTASLKDKYLNDESFYGVIDSSGMEYNKEYSFVLTVSLKDEADNKYDMSKYRNDDEFIIPDTASITMVNPSGETVALNTNKVDVRYLLDPKPIKSVNDFDQTKSYENGSSYVYTITQTVLGYKGNQKFKSFVLKDEFEEPILISSKNSVSVRDELGQDVTSWFDVDVNKQKLTVTLKDSYNTDDFYGHTYSFIISVRIDQTYNLKKYLSDNQYVIPNYATVTFDGNVTNKTNVVNVTVNPRAVPKVIKKKTIIEKIPDTASPLGIAMVAVGVVIIVSGVYAILEKYNLVPGVKELGNVVSGKGQEPKKESTENVVKSTPKTTSKTPKAKTTTTKSTTRKTTSKKNTKK